MNNQRSVNFWLGTIIAVLAGAWTIFHLIWNFSGNGQTDDYWGIGLLILFALALILAFFEYARERPTLKATTPNDRFPEPAISRFFLASPGSSPLWFVVRMNVGATWLLAGFEKVGSPVWGTSGKAMAGFVAGALAKASGTNPSVQGWYSWFLQHLVQPNPGLWSFLITWGEVAVGLGVLLGVLTGLAAGFGVLINMNYLLSGVVSINPVLGMFGLFLVISWRVCGYIGFDRWLLPALGMPWKPGPVFRGRAAPSSGQ